jgi:hypothetical protein
MISHWKELLEAVVEIGFMSDNCADMTFYLRLLTLADRRSRENVSAKSDKMSFRDETASLSNSILG